MRSCLVSTCLPAYLRKSRACTAVTTSTILLMCYFSHPLPRPFPNLTTSCSTSVDLVTRLSPCFLPLLLCSVLWRLVHGRAPRLSARFYFQSDCVHERAAASRCVRPVQGLRPAASRLLEVDLHRAACPRMQHREDTHPPSPSVRPPVVVSPRFLTPFPPFIIHHPRARRWTARSTRGTSSGAL